MFQRLMENVLSGLQWQKVLVYIDDIIVLAKNDFSEAVNNLQCVFDRLRKAGLKLKAKKCNLFKRKVHFLGHIVTPEGISCEPDKVAAVREWTTPKNVSEIRSFLGLCNYYRKYVKSYAKIAGPLTDLTKKGKAFIWTEECEQAFVTLKSALTEAPVLAYPSFDPNDKWILDTDASQYAIGGVLSQIQNGKERVIAYASQTLSRSQRNYCTTYRELLAVVNFVKHFKHYLLGRNFTIRTDHSSLRWLLNFKDTDGIVARWLMSLQSFDFTIVHRRGIDHGNADALSRKQPIKRRRHCDRESCDECVPGTVSSQVNAVETRQVAPGNHSNNSSNANSHQTGYDSQNGQGEEGYEPIPPETLRADDLGEVSERQNSTSGNDSCSTEAVTNSVDEGSNWMGQWSRSELSDMQQGEEAIKKVIVWLKEQKRPTRQELRAECAIIRDLCSQWQYLEIHDDVLYRKWTPKCQSLERLQYVTPSKLKNEIFRQVHDSRLGGHLGINRTLMKIRQRFYWPRCKTDVIRWCRECAICAQVKPGPGYRATLQQSLVRHRLDRVALDILGELPQTDNGNKYILVISDYFTKWTHAVAIPDQTALTIADKLLTEFIVFFGAPKQIHTDQGKNFDSNLFKEVCNILDIEKTRTTPFHAQSDGQVERWNRTIQQMLKSYVNENRDHLPYLCMAYRATPHESTGCSPNLMMFGQEINMPIDIMVGSPPKSQPNIRCPIEYVEWLRNSLTSIYQYATTQLNVHACRQKEYYDLKAKPVAYPIGSFVWRWYWPAARGKLSKGWVGPFKILECPTRIHCIIQRTPDSPQIRVHIDALKPFHGDTPTSWLPENVEHDSDDNASTPMLTHDDNLDEDNYNLSDNDIPENEYMADNSESDSEDSIVEILGRGRRFKKPPNKYSP